MAIKNFKLQYIAVVVKKRYFRLHDERSTFVALVFFCSTAHKGSVPFNHIITQIYYENDIMPIQLGVRGCLLKTTLYMIIVE